MSKFFVKNKIVILLFSVFVIIYLIAWNRGLELLYVIAELSLAILILSSIAPYFNIIGITVSIKHPKYSNQRQRVPITIELQTAGFFDKYLLEVWIKTPFSTSANHMFFVKSLHKKLIIESELLSDVRGVHQIGPIRIETGFPLGLKIIDKVFDETQSEIIIFPTPYKVKIFPFNMNESSRLYRNNGSRKKGKHDEFVSVREYKKGDSPRHIHWPISAKKGELIVREYQEVLSSSLIIILDLHKDFNVGLGQESTLEYAITIAASLAIYGLNQGYSVNIFGYSSEEIKLLDIKGSHNHIEILRTLAHVKGNGNKSYTDVIDYFLSLQKNGATLVLFDNGSGLVEQNINLYASKKFKPILFEIEANSFNEDVFDKEFRIHHYPNYHKYTLKKGCDIERMFH